MAWWTVDGVHFEGTIVTVGPVGRDYTSLYRALNALPAAPNHLFLVDAGTQGPSDLHSPIQVISPTSGNVYIKAMGAVSECICEEDPPVNIAARQSLLIVEGFTIKRNSPYLNSLAHLYLYNSGSRKVVFSKCYMNAGGANSVFRATQAFTLIASNCTFYVTASGGYFIDSSYGYAHSLTNDEITKCIINLYKGAYGTTGSFKTLDYKTIPTSGYGYDYGTDLIVYHAPVLLSVTPANARLPLITGTQQFTATGVNDVGEEEDLTAYVTWTSSETGVATVDSAGLVTFVTEGDTVISAETPEGLIASTRLHVTDVTAGNKWSSDWRPPIAVCYLNGQVITVGASSSGDETPSQSRIIRWSEIGQFDFLGQSATSIRNEAGFAYAADSDKEILLNVLPLGNMAIVYGSLGCYIMRPVSKPAVTFGINRMADIPAGIPCTLAVAGSKQKHLMLGRDGNLMLITVKAGVLGGETYDVKYLGYSEFFKEMVDRCDAVAGDQLISIVYNPIEDEFYISDGITSYKFDEDGLTEMGVAVSSLLNIKNAPLIDSALVTSLGSASVGFASALQNKDDILYTSDTLTFDVPGIKTIESIVVDGSFSFDALVEVMVMWRNSKKDEFAETDWVPVSPEGFCAPLVSGLEFRLCLRAALSEDTEINKMHVTVKTSDRRFIRGNVNADRAET